MSSRLQSHFFWGARAPLSTLAAAGIIILASSRLAHAIYCLGALLWVFCLTALVYYSARSILPQKGRAVVLLFLSSLLCSLYILLTGLLSPLLIFSSWFFMVLIPPCCVGSGLFEGMDDAETGEVLPRVFAETFCLGFVIIALSLIREPLGMGSLSLPGGVGGIVEVAGDSSQAGEGFFPIRILSATAGGLLLVGFGAALYRFFQGRYSAGEEES
jgi:hypothetical protein